MYKCRRQSAWHLLPLAGRSGQGILRHKSCILRKAFHERLSLKGRTPAAREDSQDLRTDESRIEDGTHRGWGCTLPIAASGKGWDFPGHDSVCLLLLETEISSLYVRQEEASVLCTFFTDEQTETRVVNASWWRPSLSPVWTLIPTCLHRGWHLFIHRWEKERLCPSANDHL